MHPKDPILLNIRPPLKNKTPHLHSNQSLYKDRGQVISESTGTSVEKLEKASLQELQ